MRRIRRGRRTTWGLAAGLAALVLLFLPGSDTPTSAVSGGIIEEFGGSEMFSFTEFPDQPRVAGIAQDAGVRWTKEGLNWSLIEQTQGSYNFTNSDRFINSAAGAGLNIMGEFGGTPRFYANTAPPGTPDYFNYPTTSPEGRAAWARYITAVVTRYKDRVHAWQIYTNLDDAGFPYWKPYSTANPGADVYFELLWRAYNAIKAADPTATVVMASMDPQLLNLVLDNGSANFFDAASVHNYPAPFAPETSSFLNLRMPAVQDVLARRAPGKRIWVNEFGWPSAPGSPVGITEDVHAQYVVRSHMLQAIVPGVDREWWQDWRDRPGNGGTVANPNIVDDNWGLLMKADAISPKLSYNAFKAMTTELAGATFDRQNWPATVSSATIEDFESGRTYSQFLGGGATGRFSVTAGTAHTGTRSGQIDYTMTTSPASSVIEAPDVPPPGPTWQLPVAGVPKRVSVWAKGNGGPAVNLGIGFKDANGENFNVYLGLVTSTDWKQYYGYLDAAPGTSVVLGGDQDGIVQYPIVWTGFSANIWTVATPAGTGTLWVDDIAFEQGPSVFDLQFTSPTGPVHALWSLDGASDAVSLPAAAANVTVRDWRNSVTNVTSSGGVVQVTASPHPIFVRTGAAAPCPTPRPPVRITTARSTQTAGALDVTVTAGFGSLSQIVFDSGPNAILVLDGQSHPSLPYTDVITSGARQRSFTIRRVNPAAPVTVKFRAFDGCNEWKTFVGAGS